MNKKKIITISILSVLAMLIILLVVLFGAVFRVRHKTVVVTDNEQLFTYVEEEKVPITPAQIVAASGIKNGNSSVFVNKAKATSNIEQAFPYIKVVQISITGASSVEIRVCARHEMFFYKIEQNSNYYLLDEELKVLRLTQILPQGLIEIDSNSYQVNNEVEQKNFLGVTGYTKAGDFLSAQMQSVFSNLYVAIYQTVVVDSACNLRYELPADKTTAQLLQNGQLHYATRADMLTFLTKIEIKKGLCPTQGFTRIVLTTNLNIKVDIAQPEQNLQHKVNACFATICQMPQQDFEKVQSVTYGYDANQNNFHCFYEIPA